MISLHSWEADSLIKEPHYNPSSVQKLGEGQRRLAVSGQAALVRIDTGNFALLSFESDDEVEDHSSTRSSLVFSGKTVDERIGHILDFVFLEGFFEPTVAIIYESAATGPNWPASLAVRKETVELVIATANMHSAQPAFTTIFHQSGLPSECRRVFAVPKPNGGLMLAGPNLFLYLDHVGNKSVCSLNSFAHLASPANVPQPSTNRMKSRGELCFLSDGLAVWSTTEGEWHWLRLAKTGPRSSALMSIEPVTAPTKLCWPNCFGAIDGYLFAGSLHGPHQLFNAANLSSKDSPSLDHLMTDDLYGEDELYRTPTKQATEPTGLVLIAEMPSIGPVSDFTVGRAGDALELVAVGGVGCHGHATTIHQTIPLSTKAEFSLEGVKRSFVLPPNYLVLSTDHATMLMETRADRMAEVEQSAFCLEESTLLAASTEESIVQVTPSGYRVLTTDCQMVKSRVDMESPIEEACLVDDILVLRLHSGQVQIIGLGTGQSVSLDLPFPAKQISLSKSSSRFISILLTDDVLHLYCVDDGQLVFATGHLAFLPQAIVNGKVPSMLGDTSYALRSVHLLSNRQGDLFVVACNEVSLTVYRRHDDMLIKMQAYQYEGIALSGNRFSGLFGFYDGFLLDGHSMLVVGPLGYPRLHRFSQAYASLSAFDTGKLVGVSEESGLVSILSVPEMELDTATPFKSHQFDGALTRVLFNSTTGAYGAVISRPGPSFVFPDDDYALIADNKEWKPPATIVDLSGLINPEAKRYSFALLDGSTWKIIDEHRLEEYEMVASCKSMRLATKENTEGFKSFMVLGLVAMKGEDRPVRSRVLIFDAIQLVPEPGQPASSGVRLKQLTSHALKTTISTICPIAGHISVTSGFKTIIHEFEDNESLTGVAFIDAGVHLAASSAIRNFLWLGDCGGRRGVGLYAFQERPPKLVELGRTIDPSVLERNVLLVECLVNASGQMMALTADESGCLSFHAYSPATLSTFGGTRLVHNGNFEAGCRVVQMVPILCGDTVGVMWLGADGSLGLIRPLSDDQYRPLSDLQSRIITDLPHPAGLHPKGARGSPPNRQLIDLSLCARAFYKLPRVSQSRIFPGTSLVDGTLREISNLTL